ncbi:Heterokaryon incompatibility protein 6, OR allele [Pseudocercospora fuligena]|uniref:Heterokaryon incompatibility protein 6, OR allele n=1 Tax=Pseudocercospora fuligena TaxID=685502 RepID=A0A8H6R387_9PEZI|nr:Heterokaryon incompatibility protein 6, OR allele [Pseudocercospora fuligena]
MSMAFHHKALEDEKSTRVLELAPSKRRDAPLVCRLFEISLARPPQYEAISYVWGKNNQTSSILCNKRRLPITASCDAALRRFRDVKIPRLLWIDSVCIDQGTIHERNHQARIMDEVYEKATNVLIWLGEGNKATDSVFDLFHGRSIAHWKQKARLRLENLTYVSLPTSYIYYEPTSAARLLQMPRANDLLLPVIRPKLIRSIGPSLDRLALKDNGDARLQLRWKTVTLTQPAVNLSYTSAGPDANAPTLTKDKSKRTGDLVLSRTNEPKKRSIPDNIDLISVAGAEAFYEKVMFRPWFHRMWTIQEAVLASHSVFYCGSQSVAAERMLKALDGASQLYEQEYEASIAEKFIHGVPKAEHLKAISECLKLERALIYHLFWRRRASKLAAISAEESTVEIEQMRLLGKYKVQHSRIPVSDILAYASRRGSTDPHDKFFALYGILKRMDVDVPEPDYGKSVEDVFIEATNVAIKDEEKLTVLLQVTGLPSEYDLPSWVPDWSDRSRPEIIGQDIARAYSASQDSRMSSMPSLTSRELEVLGRPVNRIRHLSPSSFSRGSKDSTLLRLDKTLRNWLEYFGKHSRVKITNNLHALNTWSFFFLALNYESPALPPRIFQATEDYLAILIHVERQNESMDKFLSHARRHPKLYGVSNPLISPKGGIGYDLVNIGPADVDIRSLDNARIEQAFDRREHFSRSLADRAFFWGFDGYCGTASSAVKRGDDIVLLSGLEMPAVVRHHDKELSKFVSAAYIREYMFGAHWDRLRPRTHERKYLFV